MTLEQFTTAWNHDRKRQGKHAEKFSVTKRKVTKKQITHYKMNDNGIPVECGKTPAISKVVEDTNGKTYLFKCMWSLFLGSEMKRISSEGNYRHGIGFIKSPNKGIADLMGGYKGITYYIEVKQNKEKLLPSQIKFKAWVESFGGQYHIARTYDEMYALIQSISTP